MTEKKIEATESEMAQAFNEWMRRYIEEPERFAHELKSVRAFEKAESEGQEPDYGADSTSYLCAILDEHRRRNAGAHEETTNVGAPPPEPSR
jgi:hypothetical protein